MKRSLLFILLFCCCGLLGAQSEWITVDDILVEGYKQTKRRVIIRELPFAHGDTILLSDLPEKIREGERQLMNTGLFNSAEITYANWEGATNKVSFNITVTETWYLYPFPIFELADRNFNVWWREQGRSLNRVNIGLEFSHYNFTGWQDKFEVGFKYGYTRSYSVEYKLPYLNRAGTLGLSTRVNFARNRELNYRTEGNKQLFFGDDDRFLRQRFEVQAGLAWRPALYGNHTLEYGYFQNWVDPLIIQEYNPNYYANGSNRQRYFRLAYIFNYDFRDIRAYPWEGYYLEASLEKDGLGFFDDRNALTLRARAEKFIPFGNQRWSLGLVARAKYSFIREFQPYNDNRALGFGRDKVTGFDLYIIDGLDATILRSNLRFEIWRGNIEFGEWVFIEAFRTLPFRVNLSLANDVGVANDPFVNRQVNPLSNRLLYGGGLGLDFIFYYDFVFRVSYQYNDLGEGGFIVDFSLGL